METFLAPIGSEDQAFCQHAVVWQWRHLGRGDGIRVRFFALGCLGVLGRLGVVLWVQYPRCGVNQVFQEFSLRQFFPRCNLLEVLFMASTDLDR
jgi:hypothetical protein